MSSMSDILESISVAMSKSKRAESQNKTYKFEIDDVEAQAERKDDEHSEDSFAAHSLVGRAKRLGPCKCIAIIVMTIVLLSLFGTVVSGPSVSEPKTSDSRPTSAPTVSTAATHWNGKKFPTLHDMRMGTFAPRRQSINWIEGSAEGGSGAFIIKDGGKYYAHSWEHRDDDSFKVEITDEDVLINGINRHITEVVLNKDHSRALVKTDSEKNWRHSSFANFWILDIKSHTFEPLYPKRNGDKMALAHWSPDGSRIAFVLENNVYIRDVESQSVHQITSDGGDQMFYGRPDWVYEEEIFSGANALWWSRNGKYLGFLKTNETMVPEYPIPYFAKHNDDGTGDGAYPDLVKIKYPKPGFPNPQVSMMFLEVGSSDNEAYEVDFDDDIEKLITEVVWTDKDEVIVRMTNRQSDTLKLGLLNAKHRTAEIVRTSTESSKDGGWFEVTQNTMFIPANPDVGRDADGYIDTIVVDGYNHLAYFSPMNAIEPAAILTSGKWEVDSSPLAVNLDSNLVFFMATERSPIERHLYYVGLDGKNMTPLTYSPNSKGDGDSTYSVSVSKDLRYALVTYEGPNVPTQEMMELPQKMGDSSKSVAVERNDDLKVRLKEYALPTVTYSQVEVDQDDEGNKIMANAMEIKPANFDPSKKYPVLFFVYGGPVSQTVKKQFSIDFQKIMPSTLDAIVVTVDGRGTGFMGRKFRAVVRDNLGDYEARDQISAAKLWAKKDYVDETKLAIWGWSYGGYMTLKTLETDGGETFRYGMAVAPVTNWRFYNSIYTERYMHDPSRNAPGYDSSRIKDGTRLAKSTRFLIMHGTGDDNVHLQNTLVLLDLLDEQNVENYDMHVFPDSDHSIYFHNANTVVYDKLQQWISNAFAGRFDQ